MTTYRDTVTTRISGIRLLMPRVLSELLPCINIDDFPNFCGAGDGIGEALVPDTFYGLSMRHCCFIHDITHTIYPPTKTFWHKSNELLLINCLRTIRVKSGNRLTRFLRERRALTYFNAVESGIGLRCFMRRRPDGPGVEGYDPVKDPEFKAKLLKVGVRCDTY